jgi:hypothetical protein
MINSKTRQWGGMEAGDHKCLTFALDLGDHTMGVDNKTDLQRY